MNIQLFFHLSREIIDVFKFDKNVNIGFLADTV